MHMLCSPETSYIGGEEEREGQPDRWWKRGREGSKKGEREKEKEGRREGGDRKSVV